MGIVTIIKDKESEEGKFKVRMNGQYLDGNFDQNEVNHIIRTGKTKIEETKNKNEEKNKISTKNKQNKTIQNEKSDE